MSYAERTLSILVSGAPAWWTALPDKTWTQVATGSGSGASSGATIYQARPSPQPPGLFDLTVWSSCGVDQSRGELLTMGGGHTTYAGNEVYALNVRAATPAWEALCSPSPGCFLGAGGEKNGTGQNTTDVGVNGYPMTGHNTRLVFANDQLWLVGIWALNVASNRDVLGNAIANDTQGTSRVFAFHRTHLRWRAFDKFIPNEDTWRFPAGFMQNSPAIYMPVSNRIWVSSVECFYDPYGTLFSIDAKTGQLLSTYTNSQFFPMPAAWGVALGNTYLAAIGTPNNWAGNGSGLFVLDTSNPAGRTVPVRATVTDSTGLPWSSEVSGAVYHAASNAILVYPRTGQDIVKLAIPADPLTGTWVASVIAPANAADPSRVIPSNTGGYVYSRFNIVSDMGDGRSALVLLGGPNPATAPTYVYKIPAGGM